MDGTYHTFARMFCTVVNFLVNPAISLFLCSCMRRSRSFMIPVYNVRDIFVSM
jgi:hypothetical protein